MKKKLAFWVLWLFLSLNINAQPFLNQVTNISNPDSVNLHQISFRGIGIYKNTIWVSGTKGTFAVSQNGGKNFEIRQVKSFNKSDFRSVQVINSKTALLVSSGTPAVILRTENGGQTWSKVLAFTDSAYFFDAVSFSSKKNGLVVADPIGGRFVFFETKDGGKNWQPWDSSKNIAAMPRESLFAASGSCLLTNRNKIYLVTGGKTSRLLIGIFKKGKIIWQEKTLPILQGKSSQGAFAVATNKNQILVTGGDYTDTSGMQNNAVLFDTIEPIKSFNGHYLSGVASVFNNSWVACSTSGVFVMQNKNWQQISNQSYHVIKVMACKKVGVLAGSNGKISLLTTY